MPFVSIRPPSLSNHMTCERVRVRCQRLKYPFVLKYSEKKCKYTPHKKRCLQQYILGLLQKLNLMRITPIGSGTHLRRDVYHSVNYQREQHHSSPFVSIETSTSPRWHGQTHLHQVHHCELNRTLYKNVLNVLQYCVCDSLSAFVCMTAYTCMQPKKAHVPFL